MPINSNTGCLETTFQLKLILRTFAEVTDADGVSPVCPTGGAVLGDKGYCVDPAKITLKRRGCHDATIKKNNMKGKDRHKDRWLSAMRSPYERVFAHRNKRVRDRGLEKVQFRLLKISFTGY